MITLESILEVVLNMSLCLFGLSIQMATILSSMGAKENRLVWPREFIKKRPWKCYTMLAGAVVGYFIVTGSSEDPSGLSFIAMGYAANDIIDKMGTIKMHMNNKQ